MTTYITLRAANEARQIEWDKDNNISLAYRGNELAGEVGEACNVIKKLERERMGIRGSRANAEQLAEELADAVICVDLIAMQAGIDLDKAVRAKFNATSEKYGLETRFGFAQKAKVRPLVWEETFTDRGDGSQDQTGWVADSGFGSWYDISQYFASDSYGWQVQYNCEVIADRADPDQAKADAQAHFEKSVLAALAVSSTDRHCQKCGRATKREEAWVDGQIWCHPCADLVRPNAADEIIGQVEARFPNWRSYRDLIDCIDCTLHDLRGGR